MSTERYAEWEEVMDLLRGSQEELEDIVVRLRTLWQKVRDDAREEVEPREGRARRKLENACASAQSCVQAAALAVRNFRTTHKGVGGLDSPATSPRPVPAKSSDTADEGGSVSADAGELPSPRDPVVLVEPTPRGSAATGGRGTVRRGDSIYRAR